MYLPCESLNAPCGVKTLPRELSDQRFTSAIDFLLSLMKGGVPNQLTGKSAFPL